MKTIKRVFGIALCVALCLCLTVVSFAAGTPEEIFQEQRIRELYDIRAGFYDPLFGSIELAKPVGEPQVFVWAGNGSGIPVYRDLQRRGIPFATGILYENDVDVRLARLLAAEMVVVPLGAPIPEEAVTRAKELAARCKEVIVAPGAKRPETPFQGSDKR